jgi:hypothetical protein
MTALDYSERRSGLAKQIGLGLGGAQAVQPSAAAGRIRNPGSTTTAISATRKTAIGDDFELVVAHGMARHSTTVRGRLMLTVLGGLSVFFRSRPRFQGTRPTDTFAEIEQIYKAGLHWRIQWLPRAGLRELPIGPA